MFKPGDRVECHPATDSWMMGDRYGTVTKIGYKYIYVRMDKSNKIKHFPGDLLTMIGDK